MKLLVAVTICLFSISLFAQAKVHSTVEFKINGQDSILIEDNGPSKLKCDWYSSGSPSQFTVLIGDSDYEFFVNLYPVLSDSFLSSLVSFEFNKHEYDLSTIEFANLNKNTITAFEGYDGSACTATLAPGTNGFDIRGTINCKDLFEFDMDTYKDHGKVESFEATFNCPYSNS